MEKIEFQIQFQTQRIGKHEKCFVFCQFPISNIYLMLADDNEQLFSPLNFDVED